VKIAIVTDGQTNVTAGGSIALEAIGGQRATQLFTGNLVTSGSTLTRGDGADLGSFIDDGFAIGQTIRVTVGGTTVDRRIVSISATASR
jgi:hypothetical protein